MYNARPLSCRTVYIYRQGLGEERYDAPAGLDVCGDWLHFLVCMEDVRTASLNDHFGL